MQSDMSEDNASNVIFKARKDNLYRAIKLLQPKDSRKKRNREQRDDEKEHMILMHCSSAQHKERKRQYPTIGFSKSLTLLEMKSYLLNHNWKLMQNLFPLLLNYSNDLEPVIWRYALILLLYSPTSALSNIQEFLELCTGTRNLNEEQIFKKLLSLNTVNL